MRGRRLCPLKPFTRCQALPSAMPFSFSIPGSASPGLPTSPGHLVARGCQARVSTRQRHLLISGNLRPDRVTYAGQAPPQSRAYRLPAAAAVARTRPLTLQITCAEPQPLHAGTAATVQPRSAGQAGHASVLLPPSLTVSQRPALSASRLKSVCAQP